MESCIRNFWWGQTMNHRKIHLISWENLIKPLRQGGIGLRRFEPFNNALLTK